MTARKCKVCGRVATTPGEPWCEKCNTGLDALGDRLGGYVDIVSAAEWGAKRRAAASKARQP